MFPNGVFCLSYLIAPSFLHGLQQENVSRRGCRCGASESQAVNGRKDSVHVLLSPIGRGVAGLADVYFATRIHLVCLAGELFVSVLIYKLGLPGHINGNH